MPKAEKRWVRVKTLSTVEKLDITAACERLIDETLRPRFLPEVRPTTFNYPIAIFGRWRGRQYSFVTRYRFGHADNLGEEFDAPFAGLDFLQESISDTRFAVMWHSHTGQWWRVRAAISFAEALNAIETDPVLHPAI